MNKQHWMSIGQADFVAGHQNHKPKSGWQLVAYNAGWEGACDDKAVSKTVVNNLAKELGIVKDEVAVSKHAARYLRRAEATVARIRQRHAFVRNTQSKKERRVYA